MNVEEYRNYCLSLGDGVEERFPFSAFRSAKDVLVFYVQGHMFAFFDLNKFTMINLRCRPEEKETLIEHYSAVGESYRQSAKNWIGVDPQQADKSLLCRLTADSYQIVKEQYTPRPRRKA